MPDNGLPVSWSICVRRSNRERVLEYVVPYLNSIRNVINDTSYVELGDYIGIDDDGDTEHSEEPFSYHEDHVRLTIDEFIVLINHVPAESEISDYSRFIYKLHARK